MAVTSRTELIQYCYRALGSPLVEINMTDEQADDIVDMAIEFFREYYWDGVEDLYYKHKITPNDITNKYITLPDNIWGVKRVFPNSGVSNTNTNIFDLQYQMRMNDLRDVTSTSMIYYSQMMSHLSLLDNMLNAQRQFRWNRLTSKLYIDLNWDAKMMPEEYILVDAYGVIDPVANAKFWDERYFKKYTTALFKKQWGQNVSKYSGITLPGGITLDGDKIYQQGKDESEEIEEFIRNQSPLQFILG